MQKETQIPKKLPARKLQEVLREFVREMSEVERNARKDVDSYLIQSSSAMPSKYRDKTGLKKAA